MCCSNVAFKQTRGYNAISKRRGPSIIDFCARSSMYFFFALVSEETDLATIKDRRKATIQTRTTSAAAAGMRGRLQKARSGLQQATRLSVWQSVVTAAAIHRRSWRPMAGGWLRGHFLFSVDSYATWCWTSHAFKVVESVRVSNTSLRRSSKSGSSH